MIEFITKNAGTIITLILLACLIALTVYIKVRNRKRGKKPINYGCIGCPNYRNCNDIYSCEKHNETNKHIENVKKYNDIINYYK